ncbi:MAG: single-stranded DNA-binding protein [Candidatus Latescibacteria bacterium]|nr:single-stranded DNA-binding protein [Candidatus Latescibacterota bacterium]
MNGLKMPNLNITIVSGRLTRTPELKYTQSGVPVLRARLANNNFYRTADGEWKREATFVGFVTWQALAERCYENLQKGSAVMVTGRLNSSEWETGDGEKRSQIEIRADRVQFLERKPSEEIDGQQEADEEVDTQTEEVES